MQKTFLKIGKLYKATEECKKKFSKNRKILWSTTNDENISISENDFLLCVGEKEINYILLINCVLVEYNKTIINYLEEVEINEET